MLRLIIGCMYDLSLEGEDNLDLEGDDILDLVGEEVAEPHGLTGAAFRVDTTFLGVGEHSNVGTSTSQKLYVARCLVGDHVPFFFTGDQSP